MSNYRAGKTFEYKCRDGLRAAGWFVIQSGGSKGVADLVGLKFGTPPLLVQCKRGQGPLPPAERAELMRVAVSVGGTPIHAHPGSRGVVVWRRLTGSKHPDDFELWNPEAAA